MVSSVSAMRAGSARQGAMSVPRLDPASALLFVINAAAGALDIDAKRAVIESALAARGRKGELLICGPADLPRVAAEAAAAAVAGGGAVIAVGGDGSLNAVAQAAHAAGCAMGVIPYGTFNYFARTHGIPTEPAAAALLLLDARPMPVQVAAVNERVFLVNASLGVYPELLQDREAYKARFGRSRWVAFVAACATLLRAQRRLRLHIEMGGTVRDVQTLTLFVGNNRLQLQQFGAEPEDTLAFEFQHMVVQPTLTPGRREVVVAFDGEVALMRTPIDIRVLDKPLYLLQAADAAGTAEVPEAAA